MALSSPVTLETAVGSREKKDSNTPVCWLDLTSEWEREERAGGRETDTDA